MKNKLTSEQIQEIITLYTTTNMDRYDLGKKFNVNPTSIKYWLDKNGIKSKGRFTGKYQKYPFDESFFLKETQESAYFFGFILGDGCFHHKPDRNIYQISIQLHPSDNCILEKFCNWTNRSLKAIRLQTKRNISTLIFSSTTLFKSKNWSYMGLVQNKTYFPIEPNVPSNMIKSFIIGLLDADGTIDFGPHYRIVLVNNDIIVNWYVKILRELGYSGKLKIIKNLNTCHSTVYINNKKDVISLANILNIKNCDFCLDRKWKILKQKLA